MNLKSGRLLNATVSGMSAIGIHVLLDYTGYVSPTDNDGKWILELMRRAVSEAGIREVHSHVEQFDGILSPLGFAAVVLIDESHVSAHCYSERGLLAIDVFTCGDNDPSVVADTIHSELVSNIEGLVLQRRDKVERFLQG